MKEQLLLAQQIGQMLKDRVKEVENEHPDIFSAFCVKDFTAVETGIHPRILADWNKRGLLLAPRRENKHHRLSMTEFVWILTLDRMRAFGLSYEMIETVKSEFARAEDFNIETLLNSPEIMEVASTMLGESAPTALRVFLEEPEAMTFLKNFMPTITALHGLVVLAFLSGEPFALHVDEKGQGLVLFPSLFGMEGIDRAELDRALFSTHFSISLSDMVAQALGKAPMEKVSGELKLLSAEEAAVIAALRTEKVKSVTVRMRDGGELDFLEMTTVEHADRGTRLLELMLRDGYHDINVKTARGKVVHCENTRKYRFT